MDIRRALIFTLRKLYDVLTQLDESHYRQELEILNGSSIGQHIRHIIEFFIELEKGYSTGIVNYDNRKRDLKLADDLFVALDAIMGIEQQVYKENKPLSLIVNWGDEAEHDIHVETNYNRELVYNLEHCIHHMAILRIGINTFKAIEVPEEFGVAYSTLKNQAKCVQ